MPADPASSDRSPSARPPWPALAAAAVVVPTVLAGLTLLWPRPQIEDTLARGADAALSAAGVSGASVRFDGRDATISGVSDGAARAVQTVEGVTGVRIARLTGGGAAAPAQTPALSPSPQAPSPQALPSATPSATGGATATAAATPPAGAGDLDAAAKQALQAKLAALLGPDPISFDPDSPGLTGAGRSALAAALEVVRAAPAARLELDGYVATGRGNGELTAQQLSDQRAAAVRDAMVAAGVPADHLTARGRGEDTTSRVRAFGRRVDLTVV